MQTRMLTIDDRGKTIRLHVGERVCIELDQIAGTGYKWTQPALDSDAVSLESDEYVPPAPATRPVAGNSGLRRFVFAAHAVGVVTIQTVPQTSWDGTEDERSRFVASIVVEL